MFKKSLILFSLTTPLFAAPQGSQGSAASTALSNEGIGNIVSGSTKLLGAGSQFSITAIKTVGQFTFITLKTEGQSAMVTLRVGSNVAGHALGAIGQMVQVVTIGAGLLLTSSGQVIAFLPNEIGKSLLYSSN